MDWQTVIDRNTAALRRIVAALAAMAGAGKHSLPRCLHRSILRLLRPAEAAARRMVVVAARDVAAPPSPRPIVRRPEPPWTLVHVRPRALVAEPTAATPSRPRRMRLPLTDPLPRPIRLSAKLRGPGSSGVPRILFPGVTTPFPVAPWQPPAPDDPLDATRLRLRLAAIGSALDNLPGEARRFARWRARRDAALAAKIRCRLSPLRPGRPYGISRRRARHPLHEVDEVAADLQHFALLALKPPNTS